MNALSPENQEVPSVNHTDYNFDFGNITFFSVQLMNAFNSFNRKHPALNIGVVERSLNHNIMNLLSPCMHWHTLSNDQAKKIECPESLLKLNDSQRLIFFV